MDCPSWLRYGILITVAGTAAGVADVEAQQRPPAATAPPPVLFRVDAGHSHVGFSVGFLHSRVRGTFEGVRGAITYDTAAPQRSSLTVLVPSGNIHTASKARDDHLRSSDFLDVARHPFLTFRSTAVARRGVDSLSVTGVLSIRGVEREVIVPVHVVQTPRPSHQGNLLAHFSTRFRVARRDFGVLGGSQHNNWFDAVRSATLSDSVDVEIELAGWTPDYTQALPSAEERASQIAREGGVSSFVQRTRQMARTQPTAVAGGQPMLEQLGGHFRARGRTDDALLVLKLAAEIYASDPRSHLALAEALLMSGDSAAALVAINRALAIDRYEPRAHELLRRVQRR